MCYGQHVKTQRHKTNQQISKPLPEPEIEYNRDINWFRMYWLDENKVSVACFFIFWLLLWRPENAPSSSHTIDSHMFLFNGRQTANTINLQHICVKTFFPSEKEIMSDYSQCNAVKRSVHKP